MPLRVRVPRIALAGNTMWLKVSGVWKPTIVWIKVGGVWKVSSPKIKVSGVWRG